MPAHGSGLMTGREWSGGSRSSVPRGRLRCRCSAIQSSVYNDNDAWRALDNDTMTCAITGWATFGPWWKVDLGSRQTVTGVNLTGEQLHIGL